MFSVEFALSYGIYFFKSAPFNMFVLQIKGNPFIMERSS